MAEDDTVTSHLAHRYTQSGMDKREKGAEEILGEKVAENFPKIVKGFKPQTQAYREDSPCWWVACSYLWSKACYLCYSLHR